MMKSDKNNGMGQIGSVTPPLKDMGKVDQDQNHNLMQQYTHCVYNSWMLLSVVWCIYLSVT